jgi:hypothetical protein
VGKISSSRSKSCLKENGQYLSVKSPTSEKIDNLTRLLHLKN